MLRPRPLDVQTLLLAAALVSIASSSVHGQVLARAWVPNAVIPQGEVRLVSRNGEAVVQTVLHTRFEGRVGRKISKKEQHNWGNHADALTYTVSLEEAVIEYARRKSASAEPLALVIDYVAGPQANHVDFSFSQVRREKEGFHVEPAVVWQSLPLSTGYVRKNQELILADVFGDGAEKVIRKLNDVRPVPPEEHVNE